MTTTTVLIADDHPIFRRGLREVIDSHQDFSVVAEVSNGNEALAALRDQRPTVAVLDISMPELDGLEVLAQSRTWSDPPIVVMLTMYDDYVDRAMSGGARGYLLKENAEDELIVCLQKVAAGGSFISEGVDWQPATASNPGIATPLAALTATERRVLRLLANFKTSREIGEIMCVSHRTVQNHRANMCAKLELKGAKALLQFALDHKELL